MPLGLRPSLAQGIEARQSFLRERPADACEERRADRQLGPRPVRRSFGQPQLDVDSGLDELPGRELGRPDVEEDERSRDVRFPTHDVGRPAEAADAPPGARRQAATVRLDAVDSRPPVTKVVRLGEKGPDILSGREQFPGCCVGGHLEESLLFFVQPVTPACAIALDGFA